MPFPVSSIPSGGAPSSEGPLVLIIDDDDDTRFVYAERLVQLGYRTAGEGDARGGIDAAIRLRPDVILMDLSMPGMGGIAATRELKADPRTRDCPIVVVTGSGTKWFAAAREAGCDAFFGKPFDPSALRHVLRATAESERLCEEPLARDLVKRCGCGRTFTRPQWSALASCGRMLLRRDDAVVEVRHCVCGSSLALRIEASRAPDGDALPESVRDVPLSTIVVVERDVHVRRLVLHFIGSAYLVEFHDDGYAALDRVRRGLPSALVAEIMTARLDGLSLCRLIKGDSSTARLPVLLLSVLAAGARAQQAGADAFVAKPLEKQLFVSTLLGILEKPTG